MGIRTSSPSWAAIEPLAKDHFLRINIIVDGVERRKRSHPGLFQNDFRPFFHGCAVQIAGKFLHRGGSPLSRCRTDSKDLRGSSALLLSIPSPLPSMRSESQLCGPAPYRYGSAHPGARSNLPYRHSGRWLKTDRAPQPACQGYGLPEWITRYFVPSEAASISIKWFPPPSVPRLLSRRFVCFRFR